MAGKFIRTHRELKGPGMCLPNYLGRDRQQLLASSPKCAWGCEYVKCPGTESRASADGPLERTLSRLHRDSLKGVECSLGCQLVHLGWVVGMLYMPPNEHIHRCESAMKAPFPPCHGGVWLQRLQAL